MPITPKQQLGLPTGPFSYLHCKSPHGFDSRDMTVFKDEDGTAYLFYASFHNKDIHVSQLTQDYLDVTNVMTKVLVGQHRKPHLCLSTMETTI